MGAKFSKRSTDHTHQTPPPPTQTNPHPLITPDLTSYEAACRVDPDLQSFDSALQHRTTHLITTLAAGVEVRSLSLDSLREVTGCLLEMNQEVVKVILECKEDIWNNKELFDLVEDYFGNSLLNLDFCTALEKCLSRARDNQLIIKIALQIFEVEQREKIEGERDNYYAKTLQELKNFQAAGDPFTEEFFSLFQSVYEQQTLMLEKLQKKKERLDNKLKSMKSWRKLSNIIFGATFAAVLICSVVAAAMAAPPVVAALAAAASVPMGSMGRWFNSLWKKYENEVKEQRGIVNSMYTVSYIEINDLDNIRVLVNRLEIEIESLLRNADFAFREEESVVLAMDEIKKKMSECMQTVKDLGDYVDRFSGDIRRARTVILQKIIKHPASS